MNRAYSEESISAFLDGEVSVGQKRQIEEVLQEHVAARRLFAELRALKNLFARLPTYRLDEGFVGRVLREAERRLLARTESKSHESACSRGLAASERRSAWLPYGAALSVAASVLVVVFAVQGRRPDEQRNAVAHTPGAMSSNNLRQIDIGVPIDGLADSHDKKAAWSGPQTPAETSVAATGYGTAADAVGSFGRRMSGDAPMATGQPATDGEAGQMQVQSGELAIAQNAATMADQSYVCDIQSPAAQNTVLQKFEQVLNRQRILLEDAIEANDPAKNEPEARSKPAAQPANSRRQAAETPVQQSLERVYVVEGTAEQLSNTVVELGELAAQAESQLSVRRLGRGNEQLPLLVNSMKSGGAAPSPGIAAAGATQRFAVPVTEKEVDVAVKLLPTAPTSKPESLDRDSAGATAAKKASPAAPLGKAGPRGDLANSDAPKKSADELLQMNRESQLAQPLAPAATPTAPPIPVGVGGSGGIAGGAAEKQMAPQRFGNDNRGENRGDTQRAIFIFRVTPTPIPDPAAKR